MIFTSTCPKCHTGTVDVEEDRYGKNLHCINCGWTSDTGAKPDRENRTGPCRGAGSAAAPQSRSGPLVKTHSSGRRYERWRGRCRVCYRVVDLSSGVAVNHNAAKDPERLKARYVYDLANARTVRWPL